MVRYYLNVIRLTMVRYITIMTISMLIYLCIVLHINSVANEEALSFGDRFVMSLSCDRYYWFFCFFVINLFVLYNISKNTSIFTILRGTHAKRENLALIGASLLFDVFFMIPHIIIAIMLSAYFAQNYEIAFNPLDLIQYTIVFLGYMLTGLFSINLGLVYFDNKFPKAKVIFLVVILYALTLFVLNKPVPIIGNLVYLIGYFYLTDAKLMGFTKIYLWLEAIFFVVWLKKDTIYEK